jgi:hypothetical protein
MRPGSIRQASDVRSLPRGLERGVYAVDIVVANTPTPDPSPQGGGERTVRVAATRDRT